uniref:(northern house mosquito) hypothetical protein n=1 Tax=Culex pipiens TaxID=7175 RepID=A0A8D8I6Z6_CULPI
MVRFLVQICMDAIIRTAAAKVLTTRVVSFAACHRVQNMASSGVRCGRLGLSRLPVYSIYVLGWWQSFLSGGLFSGLARKCHRFCNTGFAIGHSSTAETTKLR